MARQRLSIIEQTTPHSHFSKSGIRYTSVKSFTILRGDEYFCTINQATQTKRAQEQARRRAERIVKVVNAAGGL